MHFRQRTISTICFYRINIDFFPSLFIGGEEETPCPAGTFNPEVNGSRRESCRPCTAGSYCLEKSVEPTAKCNKGYYCPTNVTDGVSSLTIGSYGPTQVPCPPATFRNETGARNVHDCSPCPITNYCPQGSKVPKSCLRGYYCPPEVSEPQPCPIGTYGNRTDLGALEECRNCTKGWYVYCSDRIDFLGHKYVF